MRRIDVLTLGLAAPSRWNPLYRLYQRRAFERNIATASKALILRHYPDGRAFIPNAEFARAAAIPFVSGTDADGRGYWLGRDSRADVAPRTPTILYDDRVERRLGDLA